jgi:peroxin-7
VQEVSAVDWNLLNKTLFISASWDNSLRIWTPPSPSSLRTFARHTHTVYAAAWSPYSADSFASASGDATVRVWDARRNPAA